MPLPSHPMLESLQVGSTGTCRIRNSQSGRWGHGRHSIHETDALCDVLATQLGLSVQWPAALLRLEQTSAFVFVHVCLSTYMCSLFVCVFFAGVGGNRARAALSSCRCVFVSPAV